jgi:hypothetical protein
MPGIPDMPRVPGMKPPPTSGGIPGIPDFNMSRSAGRGPAPIMLVLVLLLGLGTLVFGVMALTASAQVASSTKNAKSQADAAAAKARADQQKADEDAAAQAGESPYRSYVAPVEFGSFEIKFPKTWSSYVDQENFATQVNLVLNPDFVRKTNGTDELAAAKILLQQQDQSVYMQAFSAQVKQGTLKQANITISGQRAFDLTGGFQDKRTTREVVVPVRDKVLLFINENSKYAAEFNQILSQAKVNP